MDEGSQSHGLHGVMRPRGRSDQTKPSANFRHGWIKAGFAASMIALATPATPVMAQSKSISARAHSGQTALMYRYGNWKGDCSTDGGVVKVMVKPQHGRLAPKAEAISIGPSRFTGITACHGKSIRGFVVYYTSQPGFRGIDTFKIAVTYRGRPTAIDTFTVQVD